MKRASCDSEDSGPLKLALCPNSGKSHIDKLKFRGNVDHGRLLAGTVVSSPIELPGGSDGQVEAVAELGLGDPGIPPMNPPKNVQDPGLQSREPKRKWSELCGD